MKKVNELGTGAFRPDGVSFGAHKSGLTNGPRSDADSDFSRSQQRLAYSKVDDVLEDEEEDETILEFRVYRQGKYQLIETLNKVNEEPKDDYRNMANKLNNQARKRLSNIDNLEDLEDKIDEFSGAAAGGGGPAVPLGYTAKGKPETKTQRRKRQKFNREKSYPLGENSHQNMIKEGWREFLSTITAGNIDHRKRLEIEYESTLDDIALYVDSSNKHINVYTYIPVGFNGDSAVIDVYNPPKLIGFISSRLLSSETRPCIPKTFHVKASAVAKEFQGKGMGKLIYNILATVAKSKGAGITSDHNVSTSPSAARVWNSIDRNPNYAKRVTKAGNDKFDYNGSTPFDTEDDCKRPGMGEPAIDHSLEIINGIDDQMEVMQRRHKKYTADAIRMNTSAMRRKLKHSGQDTFDEVY